MRRLTLVKPLAGFVVVLAISLPTSAQQKDVTGLWEGNSTNSLGVTSSQFVQITENKNETLTGKWGTKPNTLLTIVKGKRINAELLQWESETAEFQWTVRAKLIGNTMKLDYTCTHKVKGKIEGGTATSVLKQK